MIRFVLNSLLYFPTREILETPAAARLEFEELTIDTDDGERLQGWWIRAAPEPALGHVLFCHGNGGNIGDRVLHAKLLVDAGLDVLLFDYRGYGRSTGRPGEEGTYSDARAARAALLRREIDPERTLYLGESLGGAVALKLALESPPAGLILQSAFTGVRQVAREHYGFIPAPLVPDAYPSLERVRGLRTPLLVLHGERDEIVPVSHARALFEAAAEPRRLHLFPGVGHNDLVEGRGYAEVMRSWVGEVLPPGEA